MSIAFNDTSTYKGIIQGIEREIGVDPGDISGNTTQLKIWTAEVNIAWDEFIHLAVNSTGRWQFDDSNHDDYPIIKGNIVSGQRDYLFTEDDAGNLILDVYKVAILPSATATSYQTIYPVDVQTENYDSNILTETTITGTPAYYDKTANAVFFDPAPNYNATNGIKMYINRGASYFTYTDTTKKPGVPETLQEWFIVSPSLKEAGRKSLSNYNDLFRRKEELKLRIIETFSKRERDEQFILSGEFQEYE